MRGVIMLYCWYLSVSCAETGLVHVSLAQGLEVWGGD